MKHKLLQAGTVFLSALLVASIGFAIPAFAQDHPDDPGNTTTTGNESTLGGALGAANNGSETISLNTGTFGFQTIGQALNTIISVIFFAAGLAAFGFILLGAFNYLTAGDDSGKTDKARKMITNAVIGLILVALVYVIWLVVINLVPGMKTYFS